MEKFVQTLNLTEIDLISTQISNILRIGTPSHRRKKQKTDANEYSSSSYSSGKKTGVWFISG